MDAIKKFQELLNNLFQFEASDLDFGIYRILNYKRDRIEKFIQKGLVDKVESAFARHKDERLSNIGKKFESVKEKIIQTLGKEAFTLTKELREEFRDTPLGRDYLSIKAQKDEAETIDEIKLQVFNDLYSFFSRFYEEGDFVPQYRYSIKGHKYAIPYNGEEVKLYWANQDQYYIKTGLLFRDYTFKAQDCRVIFRIVSAKEEVGSKKATKQRFFVLDDEKPFDLEDKTLLIRFQYRELTDKEVKGYQVEGGSNTSKQEKINQKSYEEILKKIEDLNTKVYLSREYRNEKPLLLYQISRFTAKNTKDYFIHKNLKKFLSEQLDYFIKAEVLSIETLEKERFLDKHITRAKVVREIARCIIDFLSQIEDFQKKLWEKKKFVLKTEYVITTDRIPVEFYQEIWNNKEQKKEWKELGFKIEDLRLKDLKDNKLPIDTRYFSQVFKEKLLEKLTQDADLDDLLDGLLIKSENWQALNLLLGKYSEKVKCIYIDPPYNTGSDEFIYKDNYQHSSWIAMMVDRLQLGAEYLHNSGGYFISIDYHQMPELRSLLDQSVLPKNFRNTILFRRGIKSVQAQFDTIESLTRGYEYVLFYSKTPDARFHNLFKDLDQEKSGSWNNHWRGTDRPTMRYELFGIKPQSGQWRWSEERSKKAIENYNRMKSQFENEGIPLTQDNIDKWYREQIEKSGESRIDLLRYNEKNKTVEHYVPPKSEEMLTDVWLDISPYGSRILQSLFGNMVYDNPKPVPLIMRIVQFVTGKNELILDFFAGSGTTAHAVMKLNKEDGGRRKYILVEMADYFDTVMIPRLKKLCYSFNWKDGKPQDTDGISQFFKYQILEQYEDTLDNIELSPNEVAQSLFKDEYLLKYFLDYETRESPYLLNIDMLKDPFSYKLRVNLEEVGEPEEMVVDIPETFNYLLGLKVKKIKVRNNGGKYLFIFGEKEGKDIAVVWREYKDKWSKDDFKKDKEVIIKELTSWTPHIVYVNGQSVLTPKLGEHTVEIRYIEPEFKKLMG